MRDEKAPLTGYEQPRPPQDNYVADLYNRHELPPNPSQKDIEPVALELLAGDFMSSLDGAELVLGRHISADELTFELFNLGLLLMSPVPAEKKLGVLLLTAGAEQDKTYVEPRESAPRQSPEQRAVSGLSEIVAATLDAQQTPVQQLEDGSQSRKLNPQTWPYTLTESVAPSGKTSYAFGRLIDGPYDRGVAVYSWTEGEASLKYAGDFEHQGECQSVCTSPMDIALARSRIETAVALLPEESAPHTSVMRRLLGRIGLERLGLHRGIATSQEQGSV